LRGQQLARTGSKCGRLVRREGFDHDNARDYDQGWTRIFGLMDPLDRVTPARRLDLDAVRRAADVEPQPVEPQPAELLRAIGLLA
jgi:hypothetical protein